MQGSERSRLLGRESVVARLDSALVDACSETGSLILLTGEPGIGKTALTEATARRARELGFSVGRGRGWDGAGAPPFWPWLEAVRDLAQSVSENEMARAVAAAGPHLGAFRPNAAIEPGSIAPQEREDARFRLFDAFTSFMAALSSAQPLLVVLDDLHWADPSTLELLRFSAPRLGRSQVVLLGAYRDVEITAEHPLRASLLALRTNADVIALAGLDPSAVARLCHDVVGDALPAAVVRDVHARTGGNPFFVREVARLVPSSATAPSGTRLPDGVREIIERRLALLTAPCRELLGITATLGRPADVALLTALVHADTTEVETLVAEAETAGILVAPDGRVALTHDLFRETVYALMPAADRARWHEHIALTLEERAEAGHPVPPSELALHFSRAGTSDSLRSRAILHGLAATSEALRQLAPLEGLEHAERVVATLDASERSDPEIRARALLALGEAARQAGFPERASATLEDAARTARQANDPQLLARAALALHRVPSTYAWADERTRGWLTEAVARADTPRPEAVLVRAALARQDYHDRRGNDSHAMARDAVRLASELGDGGVLSFALFAQHDTMWHPGTAADRLAVAERMEETAHTAGQAEMRAEAALLSAAALLELLDRRAPGALVRASHLLSELSQPYSQYLSLTRRVTLLTMRGEFDEADRLREHAALMAAANREADGWNVETRELWALRTLQARRDQLEARLREFDAPIFRAWYDAKLVLSLVAGGRTGDARDMFAARLAGFDPHSEPFDNVWLTQATTVAEAAVAVADQTAVDQLRGVLLPYAGLGAVTAGAVDFAGAVDHYLGLCADHLGDTAEAVDRFERAVDAHRRVGAPAWARRSEDELARLGAKPRLSRSTAQFGAFRCEAGVWELRFAGRTARVKDAKGLHDLAALLARPRVQVPVGELAGAGGGKPIAAETALGADPVLDQQARASYRARIAELEHDISEAESNNDLERIARAQWELDLVIEELSAAAGLGGRTRLLGPGVERARKAVSGRIRDAMRHVAEVHPELGEHLQESVSTGTTCCYDPSQPVAWQL